MTISQGFLDALVSPRRSPELSDADDIFGFLIGSWDLEAVLYDPKGQTQRSRGELHASWMLEGRAIQDLFIFPRRADRAASGVPARATDTPPQSEPMIERCKRGALPLSTLRRPKRTLS
jgi:hypothetical protein